MSGSTVSNAWLLLLLLFLFEIKSLLCDVLLRVVAAVVAVIVVVVVVVVLVVLIVVVAAAVVPTMREKLNLDLSYLFVLMRLGKFFFKAWWL